MNRYPSPSIITPDGPDSVIAVPFIPLIVTVVPFTSPGRNNWIRWFPQSATYKSSVSVTKIPEGLLSVVAVDPEQPVPATIVVGLKGFCNELRIT